MGYRWFVWLPRFVASQLLFWHRWWSSSPSFDPFECRGNQSPYFRRRNPSKSETKTAKYHKKTFSHSAFGIYSCIKVSKIKHIKWKNNENWTAEKQCQDCLWHFVWLILVYDNKWVSTCAHYRRKSFVVSKLPTMIRSVSAKICKLCFFFCLLKNICLPARHSSSSRWVRRGRVRHLCTRALWGSCKLSHPNHHPHSRKFQRCRQPWGWKLDCLANSAGLQATHLKEKSL